MSEGADAVVIGMGPGGEDVAGRLAQAGLDVWAVERDLVGGECPYWGCVPSKMAVRAADLLAEARRVAGKAGDASVVAEWEPVARRIRQEATDDWDDRVAVERFEPKGGRFIRGEGRIVAPGRVVAAGREIECNRAVVVATGTRPAIPPVPGLSGVPYWTNRHSMAAKELPSSMVVLGGGAVGVELVLRAFARVGVRTTLVEALDRLLPLEEPEAGLILAEVLVDEGVDVRVGVQAEHVASEGHRFALELAGGDVLTGSASWWPRDGGSIPWPLASTPWASQPTPGPCPWTRTSALPPACGPWAT